MGIGEIFSPIVEYWIGFTGTKIWKETEKGGDDETQEASYMVITIGHCLVRPFEGREQCPASSSCTN